MDHYVKKVMHITKVDKDGKVRDYVLNTITNEETDNPEVAKIIQEHLDRTRPKLDHPLGAE